MPNFLVYLFFNDAEQLLYIGKASEGLGKRIGEGYIGKGGDKRKEDIRCKIADNGCDST